MLKSLLKETIKKLFILTEIDWEKEFKDVSAKCIQVEQVIEYLNKVRENSKKEYKDREKFGMDKPIIHSKSSFFVGSKEKLDVQSFIDKMTQPPLSIVGGNDKMDKTGGPNTFVYKTGIPALRGIVYDISKDKFYYVNTCPGAGACVRICYARKGNYTRYPAAYDSMTRRLNYLLNYPEKFEEQLYNELKEKCKEHKALKGYKYKVSMRWNDSGDFFSKRYIQIAKNVISRLLKEGYNIEHYAHTKVADVAKDTGFDSTSFSLGANKRELGKIDMSTQKVSDIVGSNLFSGLDLNKMGDVDKLKELLSIKLNVDKKLILTYDELMQTPIGKKRKWYVITTPGDGDDAARRPDVKYNLLTQH